MAKVKVTRQDLKRDELKDFGFSVAEFYERNRTTIWVVLGALLALWLSSKLWGMHRESRLADANRQLQMAINQYEIGLYSQDLGMRGNALMQAIQLCETIRNRFPGSKTARQALLVMGSAKFFQGNPAAAISDFTEYRETASDPDDRALAYIQIGYCHENQYFSSRLEQMELGQQALDAYSQARSIALSRHLQNRAALGQARLLEVTGNVVRAIRIYEEILQDAQALNEELEERFRPAGEGTKRRNFFDIPSAADLYDSARIAEVQVERLKSLMEDVPEDVAMLRSIPDDAPATPTMAMERVLPPLLPDPEPAVSPSPPLPALEAFDVFDGETSPTL